MKIYKIAQEEQLDLFRVRAPEKEPEKEEVKKQPQKQPKERPRFIRGFEDKGGGFFVMIKTDSGYYAYQVSFQENIYKVKEWMRHDPGECIKWLRKGFQEYEVTKDYPGVGTIIRDIKGEKNDK